ncbi:SRPBCC family protein [Nakamurella endophytica]|uniref:SRPBCC family protein n=1 Tax=Nakamurella endophytica TaxID=1748367 RepID=UPI001E499FB7|nr:SRPBCC family protein [Nakamurella endophytica]
MSDTSVRSHEESIVVLAPAQAVYDVVSDVPRTGEWSPVCRSCRWDDEATAGQVGAWFTGRNEWADRVWETRSQVAVADRGREFAWVVGGTLVRWGFRLAPADRGTSLTESWEFLPAGIARFRERHGDRADEHILDRTRQALDGIPKTLAAIKRIVEGGGRGDRQPGP